MNSTPLILWTSHPADRDPARVRSLRSMICTPLGCSPRHVDTGEVLEIADATLRQLTADDVELLGRAPAALAFEI